MTTALKDLTLKAARHWVANLILRIYRIWTVRQTTAGHLHCSHAGVGVAGSAGCVAPRGRRHELLFAVGAFVSALSEHVSPEQPGGAPLVEH